MFFLVGGATDAFNAFTIPFLNVENGWTEGAANLCATIAAAGMLVGGTAMGLVLARTKDKGLLLFIDMLVCAIGLFLWFNLDIGVVGTYVIAFVLEMCIRDSLYTESDTTELERVMEGIHQLGLFEQMKEMSDRFDELSADTPQEELDRFVEEALELIDPVITCFNSANWEDVTSPEDVEMERFVDELMRKGLNPAQIYAEDRLEEEMKARILALQED